jgi:hypothetical protein
MLQDWNPVDRFTKRIEKRQSGPVVAVGTSREIPNEPGVR